MGRRYYTINHVSLSYPNKAVRPYGKRAIGFRLVFPVSFRDLNMLSDAENPQRLELLDPGKPGR